MKTLVLTLFVAVVGVLAEENSDESIFPDPSWARPVLKSKTDFGLTLKDDKKTCDSMYSCDGCKKARICKPTADNQIFSVVTEIDCPSDRPFCNPASGTCVSEAPANCGNPDENFICMGNGKFPDKDCTKFHVCVNYQATMFECSVAGHKYHPQKQICEQSDECGIFQCSAVNHATKEPHSHFSRYFAYCNKESNGVLVVDSCPPHFKLDSDSQNCVPDCSTEGIIPDPTDCHFYYKCSEVRVSRSITYMTNTRMQCPDKQAYSPKDFLCVNEENVQQCKKST